MKNRLSKSILALSFALLLLPAIALADTTTTPETATEATTATPSITTEEDTTTTTSTTEPVGVGFIPPEEQEEDPILAQTEEIVLATTTINFRVEAFDGQFFQNDIVVTECQHSEAGTTTTLNAWCAVKQTAETEGWQLVSSWGTYGIFLSGINEYDGTDGNWWSWYTGLEMGPTGLDAHILAEGEEILLTYDINPSKSIAASSTLQVGSTTTIHMLGLDFSTWPATWQPLAVTTTFSYSGIDYVSPTGEYVFKVTTTTPQTITMNATGYLTPETITITGTPAPVVEETPTPTNTGGSSNPTSTQTEEPKTKTLIDQPSIQASVDSILTFLKSQQKENGQIEDVPTSEWLAMSFGANSEYAEDIGESTTLLSTMINYQFDGGSDLNLCAAHPRHILALLASGVPANDASIQSSLTYINDSCYSLRQYGFNGINDDIFGLFALLATGSSLHEPIVQDIITTITNDQATSGAFTWTGYEGADMTGAAINALSYAQSKGATINQTIFDNAKAYLQTTQLEDGGWGFGASDAMTTSWALMGINALGESQTNWQTENDTNPWHILTNLLTEQGYYESTWVPGAVDWFATKHAVPALLGKSWPITLDSHAVEEPAPKQTTGSSPATTEPTPEIEIETPTSTPTSTEPLMVEEQTTTLEIVVTTSTLQDIDTSTPKEEEPLPPVIKTPPPVVAYKQISNATPVVTKSIVETTQDEDIANQSINEPTEIPTETLSPITTSTTPTERNTLPKVALSLAGTFGVYLGWRFLQSLI